VRMSVGLACLTVTVVVAAALLGLVPNYERALRQGRKELCDAIAIHCSAAAQRKDVPLITETLATIVRRHPAILSAVVRDENGTVLVEAADSLHPEDCSSDRRLCPLQFEVIHTPFAVGDKVWGTVELRFQQESATGIQGWLANPLVRLGS